MFAAAIPRGVRRESAAGAGYLRKDHVFLLERYFYFLEREQEYGMLVMDEVEKSEDRRFIRRLEAYFRKTNTGRYRSRWIVPAPLFVSSDLTYPVQAADLAIYCINWGFRLASRGMDAPTRSEIAERFAPWLSQLQYRGREERGGVEFRTFGIVYVPDPYESREQGASGESTE